MELATLLRTLSGEGFSLGLLGCNTIELTGPIERLTSELRESLKAHKPTLLGMLTPEADAYLEQERDAIQREGEAGADATAFPFGANLDWWDCISESDRRELTARREPHPPCYWCGGRYHHNPQCFGQPRMPWGKHRDKPLAVVPEGYLAFIYRKGYGKEEARQSFLAELRRRYPAKYAKLALPRRKYVIG